MYVVDDHVAWCAPLGTPSADGTQPLARREREREAAGELARALARELPQTLVATLRGLPVDSPWPELLADGWGQRRAWLHREPPVPAPEISLAGRSADDWLGALSSNTRQQLRRRRRKLLDAGAELRISSQDELERDVRAFATLHRSRWDWRGGSAVLAEGVERMVARAARELAPAGRFRLYAIDVEGRTISTQIVLASGGVASHWLGGFDDEWAHLQPGIQSIYHAIEDAFERGDEIFDLGAGAQEYKSRVADRDRFVTTTSVVPRGRGYLRVRAVLLPRHLRQAAATRLPPERRQQLKRFLWSRRRRGSEQHH